MKNLIYLFCLILISGCCSYKYIDNNTYSGIVKVPSDPKNKNGIISFQVDDEYRKAILYVHKSGEQFHSGDIVHFRVAKIKDVLVATDIEEKNSHLNIILKNDNLIELHNGSDHDAMTVHTIRHIINGRWLEEGAIGNNNKLYNIGQFEAKDNPSDIKEYAVRLDITIDDLWQNNQALDLYFNINGSVTINNKVYDIVDQVAIKHSDLPH